MEIHWGKHHATYVNNLNKQISGKDLDSKSLEEVMPVIQGRLKLLWPTVLGIVTFGRRLKNFA